MNQLLQLKVELNETEPKIWRRLLIEDNSNFLELHLAIQLAMGWQNSHLFEFNLEGLNISLLDEEDEFDEDKLDASSETLWENIKTVGQTINYTYDFGDSWEHTITVEQIQPLDKKQKYPVCLGGEMNCPPEDCGGIEGFYENLEILKNPQHADYKETLQWMGKNYNAAAFNLEESNKNLKRIKTILNKMYE